MPRSAILRVKLWTAQGRVVYSDEPTLIGEVHPLSENELEVLETGVSATELSDLVGDENRLERPLGAQLVEVYASVHTGGEPMLFEAYVSADEVEQRRAVILRSFAWVALLGLANKQIGTRLGIREGTVKAHLSSAFQRIGVGDRTSAAMWVRSDLSED